MAGRETFSQWSGYVRPCEILGIITCLCKTYTHTQYSPPLSSQTDACRPARGTGTPAPWLTLDYREPLLDNRNDTDMTLQK